MATLTLTPTLEQSQDTAKDAGLEHSAGSGQTIRLSGIVSALTFALDLTEGAVPGHAIRSCLYGMRIAEEIGLGVAEGKDLYYALLLKDIGCSSNAARMCQIVGGDDRLVKHDVKLIDWTRTTPGNLKDGVTLLWRHAMPDAPGWKRALRIARLAAEQDKNNVAMIQLRCDRGAGIVRKIGFTDATAEAIRLLDEHWDGSGYPERRRGKQIPLLARILGIAQHLDVFTSAFGLDKAIQTMVERSGRWFDPELVHVTGLLYKSGALAARLTGDPHERVLDLQPGEEIRVGAKDIDRICEGFSEVVDAKSSFTYAHSLGVTHATVGIARRLGMSAESEQMLYRAALLHDIGKLRVPNTILDKPGKLTADEWSIVREHAGLTQEILERIPQFAHLARVAGQHHEKLDGSGYPYGLSAEQLCLESRLIAVADIYGALSESRPYRANLAPEQIIEIIRADVPGKLDPDCFEALLRWMEDPQADGK